MPKKSTCSAAAAAEPADETTTSQEDAVAESQRQLHTMKHNGVEAAHAHMMATLARLVQDHDKDTSSVGNELRTLDPSSIPNESILNYSWLLNHVLGQLQNSWEDSYVRHKSLVFDDAHPVIFRNYAVASFYAGHPFDAWHAQTCYKDKTKLPDVDVIMRLSVLQYASNMDDPAFVKVLEDSIKSTDHWTGSTPGVQAVASALNNTVSIWMEQKVTADAPVNTVMLDAAKRSQNLWESCGTWVNNERGWYLRVLVANHLSLWSDARDAATRGISIIDANGNEDVDRAFFLIELARAYKGLGQSQEQHKAFDSAVVLADAFDEPGLRDEFDNKVKDQ